MASLKQTSKLWDSLEKAIDIRRRWNSKVSLWLLEFKYVRTRGKPMWVPVAGFLFAHEASQAYEKHYEPIMKQARLFKVYGRDRHLS